MPAGLCPVSFNDLPGWHEDDPRPVLKGLRQCADHVSSVKPYRTGTLGLTVDDFAPVFDAVRMIEASSAEAARRFMETQFRPFRVDTPGHVTAYYEPEIDVSSTRTGRFRFPFYRRPDDLVDIDQSNRPAGMDRSFAYGRVSAGVVGEYPDRRAIDEGYLDGRDLEIAWAESPVDVYFVHVQGAARLKFPDGTVKRITFAAKTGHPYTSIGKEMTALGIFGPAGATMRSIRDWFDLNPGRVDEILWRNRSFIFFREAKVDDPAAGPIAAAKVPLIPMRSLAVDRFIHTFATPVFISADELTHLTGCPFRQLMLAQDTGSAIVGPARGDIFVGSGAQAGERAGSVNNAAVFHILVPAAAEARYR